jgi:hypothetical protein
MGLPNNSLVCKHVFFKQAYFYVVQFIVMNAELPSSPSHATHASPDAPPAVSPDGAAPSVTPSPPIPIEGRPEKVSLPTFQVSAVASDSTPSPQLEAPMTESRDTPPPASRSTENPAKRKPWRSRQTSAPGVSTEPINPENASTHNITEQESPEPQGLDALFPHSPPPKPLSPAQLARKRRQQRRLSVWKARGIECLRLGLFAGLFYGMWLWASLPQWHLTPQHVRLENNHMIQDARLLQRLSPYMGQHLFWMNPAEIRHALLEKDSLLANVQVKRILWPTPQLLLRVSEHRLWGLVHDPWEKPKVLAWYANPAHKPTDLIPAPYAFVVGNYQNRRFASGTYRLPRHALTEPYTLMFLDTKWYRAMPEAVRKELLMSVDRAVQGLEQMPDMKVSNITITRGRDMTMDVRYKNSPLLIRAGLLDLTLFKRLARIKPTLHVLDKLNTPGKAQTSRIDRLDARWNENIYLHRQNGEQLPSDTASDLPPRA